MSLCYCLLRYTPWHGQPVDDLLADYEHSSLNSGDVLLVLLQYASWNGQKVDDFFGSPQAREDFKNHISFMVNRTNTVNGRKYRCGWVAGRETRVVAVSLVSHASPQRCHACGVGLGGWGAGSYRGICRGSEGQCGMGGRQIHRHSICMVMFLKDARLFQPGWAMSAPQFPPFFSWCL